jgi:hypothetical protein
VRHRGETARCSNVPGDAPEALKGVGIAAFSIVLRRLRHASTFLAGVVPWTTPFH